MAQRYRSLRDYFDQTGTTQQSLATKLGVTRQTVHYWVKRKNEPDIVTAFEIEALTGVPVRALAREDGA